MSKYRITNILVIPVLIIMISGLPSVTNAEQRALSDGYVNGLSTAALGGVVDNLKKDPKSGRVTFYSTSVWQNGMRAFTSFGGYSIDGNVVHEGRRFILLGDESVELSGTDSAPGAIEELMYALGTCIIASTNANAALMGVKLNRLNVRLESDLDIHGLFAVDAKVRPGILNIRAEVTIGGDADAATLEKIAMLGYKYSPVSETIRNGINFIPEIYVSQGAVIEAELPDEAVVTEASK